MMRGPADADFYRIKVGRGRRYIDPLNSDGIWEQTDMQFPSVTATKPPFANQYVPMRTVADMPASEWGRLAHLDPDDRYDAIKSNDRKAGRVNMDRGTIVHAWAEDLVAGRALMSPDGLYPPEACDAAAKYRAPLEQFFADYQPEPFAVEVPCFHRELVYAGTADLLCDIPGMGRWWIDWKSRKNDHGAYVEEAAQGGAYGGSEYMITLDDQGEPVRTVTPAADGVLIVSITKDSYRCYPIPMEDAVAAYHSMLGWWQRQQVTKFQNPWPPKAAVPVASTVASTGDDEKGWGPVEVDGVIDRDVLRDRMRDLIEQGGEERLRMRWPVAVPPLSRTDYDHTQPELASLLDAVRAAEADIGAGWHPSDLKPSAAVTEPSRGVSERFTVDERGTVDRLSKGKLAAEFESLPQDAAVKIGAVTGEAAAAGWSVSLEQQPSVRRWSIGRMLIMWAKSGLTYDDLFTKIAEVAHEGQISSTDDTCGAIVGKFSVEQADMVADWVNNHNNK